MTKSWTTEKLKALMDCAIKNGRDDACKKFRINHKNQFYELEGKARALGLDVPARERAAKTFGEFLADKRKAEGKPAQQLTQEQINFAQALKLALADRVPPAAQDNVRPMRRSSDAKPPLSVAPKSEETVESMKAELIRLYRKIERLEEENRRLAAAPRSQYR